MREEKRDDGFFKNEKWCRVRVLVTGANGFVGQHLITQLASAGHAVVATARRPDVTGLPDNTDLFNIGELSAATDWRYGLEGADAVVHLAARTHVIAEAVADPMVLYRRINVEATQHLAACAAAAGVRRFVFVSSIKVNGEETVSRPFTSEDIPAPIDPYGKTKMEAEAELTRICNDSAMTSIILRPPLVYGEGVKGNFFKLMQAIAKRRWLPLGAISNQRSFIYVGNLVGAIQRAIENSDDLSGTYLVRDGEDLSTTELCQRLAQAIGVTPRLIPTPTPLLRLAGSLARKGTAISRLTGSLQIDDTSTRNALQWRPGVDVDQGLALTAAWYRSL